MEREEGKRENRKGKDMEKDRNRLFLSLVAFSSLSFVRFLPFFDSCPHLSACLSQYRDAHIEV
jgi:hypothetical protein